MTCPNSDTQIERFLLRNWAALQSRGEACHIWRHSSPKDSRHQACEVLELSALPNLTGGRVGRHPQSR